jgi:hypothetical protein
MRLANERRSTQDRTIGNRPAPPMRTFTGVLIASTLMPSATAAEPAAASPSEAASADAARLYDTPEPQWPDLFQLKQKLGAERFRDVAQEVGRRAMRTGRGAACLSSPAGMRLLAGMELAIASTDEAAWRAKRASADAALKRLAELRQAVLVDRSADAVYQSALIYARLQSYATDPRFRELFGRAAADQFVRLALAQAQARRGWAAGVDPDVQPYVRAHVGQCDVDLSNSAWLKDDLKANGWPRISTSGAAADGAAFLIAQHADFDPAFQAQVLDQLSALLPAKETQPQNYALLYDRVAVGAGRLQRYGSQGRCTSPGTWSPWPIEDPANLDARRAAVGLTREATYAATMGELCLQATP